MKTTMLILRRLSAAVDAARTIKTAAEDALFRAQCDFHAIHIGEIVSVVQRKGFDRIVTATFTISCIEFFGLNDSTPMLYGFKRRVDGTYTSKSQYISGEWRRDK